MTGPSHTSTTTASDAWLARPLVDGGVLTAAQIAELQQAGETAYWAAAVRRGWTADEAIARLVADVFKVPAADLSTADVRLTPLLPEAVARKYRVVTLAADSGRITLATADPRDLNVEHELRFLTGRDVQFAVAAPAQILLRLDELYRPEASVERLLDGLDDVEVETEVEPEPK
ncbi:MAG TPA: hypothetical protein VL295_09475, partial [Gemmatimonadales bacterium]|nr:hypothetical protein [Gemmatimonadales bacterium]